MISFKNYEIFKSYENVAKHPKLKELEHWVLKETGKIIVTCAHEKRNYSSVHDMVPLQGLDIRERIYNDPEAVEKMINTEWMYDPTRPLIKCAILHDTGRGNHIHLQACDRTVFIPSQP